MAQVAAITPAVVDNHSRNETSFDSFSGFSLRGCSGQPGGRDGAPGGEPSPDEYHRLSGACHGCCPDIKLTRRWMGGFFPRHLEP